MRDLVVLCGGYALNIRNASAVRALGLAQMFQSLGFQVIVMGEFRNSPAASRRPSGVLIDGVVCRNILQPIADRPCGSYVVDTEPLFQVVDEQRADRVRAILCYNYLACSAWSMIWQARRRGSAPILDCTEWYGWEGRKVLRNLRRLAGVETRMLVLTRMAGNVSCASRWFRVRGGASHGALALRSGYDPTRVAARPDASPGRPAHLIYSGSPA